jgi:hypothetical protein
MFNKLSFRDSGVEAIASSIYFSGSAARAMKQVSEFFPDYNKRRSEDHNNAVKFVIESMTQMIDIAATAHEIDKNELIEKLKAMISGGLS